MIVGTIGSGLVLPPGVEAASAIAATRLATLRGSAPATQDCHTQELGGKEEVVEVVVGLAAGNMEQASVSSATGMDTLPENVVRRRTGVTSATSLGILQRIVARRMSAMFATRRGTWPKIAQMGTRRPATAARGKDTLPWIARAARGS